MGHPIIVPHDFDYLSLKPLSPFSHDLVDTSSLLSISIGSSPSRKNSIGQEAVFHADHESLTYVGGNLG